MYERYYRLAAEPFRLSPDPRFCYQHPSYVRARKYMEYALRRAEGFIMVTGRPGTGKTTLVEDLLAGLPESRLVAARLLSAQFQGDELLRKVAFAFGIEARGADKATLVHLLERLLLQQAQRGRGALLVIDEAQGLSPSALEELRLLTNILEGARPLLQIFLVGQEQLREVVQAPEMEQFHQRLIATCHLRALEAPETRAYIEHRLRRAGWGGDPAFTGDALVLIHRFSRGIPRRINQLCSRLLLHGAAEERQTLAGQDVLDVVAELREEVLAPSDAPEDIELRDLAATESAAGEAVEPLVWQAPLRPTPASAPRVTAAPVAAGGDAGPEARHGAGLPPATRVTEPDPARHDPAQADSPALSPPMEEREPPTLTAMPAPPVVPTGMSRRGGKRAVLIVLPLLAAGTFGAALAARPGLLVEVRGLFETGLAGFPGRAGKDPTGKVASGRIEKRLEVPPAEDETPAGASTARPGDAERTLARSGGAAPGASDTPSAPPAAGASPAPDTASLAAQTAPTDALDQEPSDPSSAIRLAGAAAGPATPDEAEPGAGHGLPAAPAVAALPAQAGTEGEAPPAGTPGPRPSPPVLAATAPAPPAVQAEPLAPLAVALMRLGVRPESLDDGRLRVDLQGHVPFDTNSAEFGADSRLFLSSLAVLLGAAPAVQVEVVGHTDAAGPPEHNLALSRRRAEAVSAYLAARGVSPGRLRSTGRGSAGAEPPGPDGRASSAGQRKIVIYLTHVPPGGPV